MHPFPLWDETVEPICPASPVTTTQLSSLRGKPGTTEVFVRESWCFTSAWTAAPAQQGALQHHFYILPPRFVDENMEFSFSSIQKQFKKRRHFFPYRSPPWEVIPLHLGHFLCVFLFPLVYPPYLSFLSSCFLNPHPFPFLFPTVLFFGLILQLYNFKLFFCVLAETTLIHLHCSSLPRCLWQLFCPCLWLCYLFFKCLGTTWRNWVQQAEPKLSPKRSDCCPAHLVRPKRGTAPWSVGASWDSSDGGGTFLKRSRRARSSSTSVHVNVIKWPAAAAVLAKLEKSALLCPTSAGGAAVGVGSDEDGQGGGDL